jgi:hypothetical protein
MLREVLFFPLARRAGPRVALFLVFLYSGLYHEIFSVMAGSGYGGPTLYFLVQYLGLAIENTRPARRVFRGHPWLGRAWTLAVVALPVGLFLHPGIVDGLLVPILEEAGVPGLRRNPENPSAFQVEDFRSQILSGQSFAIGNPGSEIGQLVLVPTVLRGNALFDAPRRLRARPRRSGEDAERPGRHSHRGPWERVGTAPSARSRIARGIPLVAARDRSLRGKPSGRADRELYFVIRLSLH